MTNSQVLLILLWFYLLLSFIIEGSTKFQLEVSKINVIFFPHPSLLESSEFFPRTTPPWSSLWLSEKDSYNKFLLIYNSWCYPGFIKMTFVFSHSSLYHSPSAVEMPLTENKRIVFATFSPWMFFMKLPEDLYFDLNFQSGAFWGRSGYWELIQAEISRFFFLLLKELYF